MEAPENGHSGIGASLPKKASGSITQLKCICPNACSVGSKQENLEGVVQDENYGTVAITETWWDDWHHWSGAMDGGEPFRTDRQGMRGGVVALYVRECFDCLELDSGDASVEGWWVRIVGKANRADIQVGVGYRSPNQDRETDKKSHDGQPLSSQGQSSREEGVQEVAGVCGRDVPDTAGEWAATEGTCWTCCLSGEED